MGDGLGVVVLEVIGVAGARAGIQRQETPVIDGEMGGIEVPVLAQDSTTREQAVGVIRAAAGAHEHLPHGVEMTRRRQPTGVQWRGAIGEVRLQEGVDGEVDSVVVAPQLLANVRCQRREVRMRFGVQVHGIGHVRVELAGREAIGLVLDVTVAELEIAGQETPQYVVAH